MPRRILLLIGAIVIISQLPGCVRPERCRVACVGDSITSASGYPEMLRKMLGPGYAVKNFGVSRTTLLRNGEFPYWKTPQFSRVANWEPDIVIIKLGTNDTLPQNFKFKNEFTGDLRAMVEHFATLPSKPKIYLCLPIPAPERHLGHSEANLQHYLSMIKQVAQEKGLPVIDLHAALDGHPELLLDGVHPNKGGAEMIARTVHQALTKP